MRAYIIRRLLLVIPTLLVVTLVVFFMVRMIPGDIVDLMVEDKGFLGTVPREAIMAHLGLDQPAYIQYGRWLGVVPGADGSFSGIFQGNLGLSLWTRISVLGIIVERLPVTLELGILALLTSIIISLPIGVYSALRQNSAGDYVSRSFATVLIALPNFWAGLMIILASSIWFGLSPPLEPLSFIKDPIGHLGQFLVPAFVLGMAGIGVNVRLTRSMMLEVLRQDYIRTAWAKGLRERVVVMRHALKNALIPVVTLVGLRVSGLIGGTVIIETVFSLPGTGRLLVDAILYRDYTVVSGVVFVFAGFLVLVNLAVDITYGYLDPRVHYK